MGLKCTCELTQENHIAAVMDARRLGALGTQDAGQSLHVEQYWTERDGVDPSFALPPLRISWGKTLMVCATCLFLGLLFLRGIDGVTKWGSQINTANTGIDHIDNRR